MTKPFKNLVAQMSSQRQECVRQRTLELSKEMALQELRQAMELT